MPIYKQRYHYPLLTVVVLPQSILAHILKHLNCPVHLEFQVFNFLLLFIYFFLRNKPTANGNKAELRVMLL